MDTVHHQEVFVESQGSGSFKDQPAVAGMAIGCTRPDCDHLNFILSFQVDGQCAIDEEAEITICLEICQEQSTGFRIKAETGDSIIQANFRI